MKQIVKVYTHKVNGKVFELIPEITMGDKVCLEDRDTKEQKFYAPSTLKRHFYFTEQEVEINDTLPMGLRANLIRNEFYRKNDVQVKETKSYIGIMFGKKSVAQIAFTQKRLTVSINKDEFYTYLEVVEDRPEVLQIVDKCFYKTAPAKYGWRMDFEIDVTDLTDKEIVNIIDTAIDARAAINE